jgi:hypothetical protein
MGKTVAVIQSNYIPWKGYFDIVGLADELILYDEVQYTKNDWRNRNRIKTPNGLTWLTIPVKHSGRFGQRICDTEVRDSLWRRKHWLSLAQSYAKAPFFEYYRADFEEAYLHRDESMLSQINRIFIELVCRLLGIGTRISWSMQYESGTGRSERLVNLCKAVGGTEYFSGPAARSYIDPEVFERGGITLRYMDYSGYPAYPQLHGEFEHAVSILDLLFNTGPQALRYMKSLKAVAVAGQVGA